MVNDGGKTGPPAWVRASDDQDAHLLLTEGAGQASGSATSCSALTSNLLSGRQSVGVVGSLPASANAVFGLGWPGGKQPLPVV